MLVDHLSVLAPDRQQVISTSHKKPLKPAKIYELEVKVSVTIYCQDHIWVVLRNYLVVYSKEAYVPSAGTYFNSTDPVKMFAMSALN